MPKDPNDKPIKASAEHGEVLLDGPGGLAESLTPGAARRSADHLNAAAQDADDDVPDDGTNEEDKPHQAR